MNRILILLAGLFFLSASAWSAGTLKVTTPNGGEKWTTGKSYAIKWNKGSAGKYVRIRLLKSGRHYRWITKKTANDGRYGWKIPAKAVASLNYKIRIQPHGKSGYDTSDRSFSISSAGSASGLSSSYLYVKGAGRVNKLTVEDHQMHIILHDFNGDGFTDVGYATGYWGATTPKGRSEIFLNNSAGRLNLATTKIFSGRPRRYSPDPEHVTIAWNPETNGKNSITDITGDGRADWLIPSSSNNSIPQKIPLIQGTATNKLRIGAARTPLINFHHGSFADIDRDGDYDLIWSLAQTHVSHNPGNGQFPCTFYVGPPDTTYRRCYMPIWPDFEDLCPNELWCGYSFANIVIDLDGDRLPEIVTSAYNTVQSDLRDLYPHLSGRVYVFKNIDGQNFRHTQTLAGPGKWEDSKGKKYTVGAADSAVADIDGDGDLDGLFYYECGDYCKGANPVAVLKNLGNGKVKRWQIFNASPKRSDKWWNKALGAPQVIDLNNDQRPDLIFNYGYNYNGSMKDAHKQIWMNKGNGKFKRLTTKIFAKVSGNSKTAKIVALHANKDKKIDWLVIWSDGTYGTLIAR